MSYGKSGGHKDCAHGKPGDTFMAKPPTVVARKHGHLERPPSQESAHGLKAKEFTKGSAR